VTRVNGEWLDEHEAAKTNIKIEPMAKDICLRAANLDVKTFIIDLADDMGYLFRLRHGAANGIRKFFHQFFDPWVHRKALLLSFSSMPAETLQFASFRLYFCQGRANFTLQ